MKRTVTDHDAPTTVFIQRKKKKQKLFRWNTREGYERFKKIIESMGHTMVDSLETWLKKRYNWNSKPPILCGKCGARNAASINSILYARKGIGCPCRHKTKWRPPALLTIDDSKKGDDAVNNVIGLIQSVGWEVAKMREATQADLAVRRTGSNGDWLPVQVKSCSTGKGRFPNLKGYSNMILAFVELNECKCGNIWLGRRDDFPATQVDNIRGNKYCGGKRLSYEPYRVLNVGNLNARLHSFDTDPYIIKRTLDYLNVPTQWTQRKEHLSQMLFRVVLTSFGHKMTPPNYENTVTDWFLNGSISVQDKTAGRMACLQYVVSFHKNNGSVNGKKQYQPYFQGDNDVYLIFVLDQEYNKSDFHCSVEDFLTLTNNSSLRGCYLFREADLISTGHIATSTQPGKVTIMLPVPNADGTFEAGYPRIHNFEPHFYHKTNFKGLIDKILTVKRRDIFVDT